jgi:VIT1/CCC1 family predicted Fe2+/Mn2+ transporter
MVVDAAERRLRFREEIWKFLQKKTRQGSAEILRAEVEVIGASLGLTGDEACREFLKLRGTLWDSRSGSLFSSMIPSAKGEDPPRNWFAFIDVCLL